MSQPVARLAIIGGTGFEQAIFDTPTEHRRVETPFGPVEVTLGERGGERVAFIARHGARHQLAPHRVPYRAHVEALRRLGVERVLATAAVGALRAELAPGTLVVLDQFIDLTCRREATFWDDRVVHTDFTEPYCPEIRAALLEAARHHGVAVRQRGCYVGVDGPRYETAAEVRAFAALGGDVVGMTGLPEAVLAREAGLCYAGLAVVTNLGAGVAAAPLTHDEVAAMMAALRPTVARLLLETLQKVPVARGCRCGSLAKEA